MRRLYIDEVIGSNMRKLRNDEKWSQTRLADLLRLYTGTAWNQQQISLAESGKRRFKVVDLFVLGVIFSVSPLRLIRTGDDDVLLQFGNIGIEEPRLLDSWIINPRGYAKPIADELKTTWPEPANWDEPLRQFLKGEHDGDD